MPENTPTQPGFYWARERDYEFFNLIVQVYGEAPFLRVDAWDYNQMETYVDIDLDRIAQFSDLIAEVAPPILPVPHE